MHSDRSSSPPVSSFWSPLSPCLTWTDHTQATASLSGMEHISTPGAQCPLPLSRVHALFSGPQVFFLPSPLFGGTRAPGTSKKGCVGSKNNLRPYTLGNHLISSLCLIERMSVLQVGVHSLGILKAFLPLLAACRGALEGSAIPISVIQGQFFLPSLGKLLEPFHL